MDKDKTLSRLIKQVNNLTKRLEVAEKRIEELIVENNELKAHLNSNSRNSNKPPSSDGYKKQPALPKKKNGKCSICPGQN